MNVLVVDDEPLIRDELCCFLRREGCRPIAADGVATAREAIEAQGRIDVVLTDMRLAEGSGIDVLLCCKQHTPVPVMLVMTGQAKEVDLREASSLGAIV